MLACNHAGLAMTHRMRRAHSAAVYLLAGPWITRFRQAATDAFDGLAQRVGIVAPTLAVSESQQFRWVICGVACTHVCMQSSLACNDTPAVKGAPGRSAPPGRRPDHPFPTGIAFDRALQRVQVQVATDDFYVSA
jgi:hypothetical protein